EEAEANREVGREEQLSMFQNRGNTSSGFSRGGGDEMAEIAGVGAAYGTQQPVVQNPAPSVNDDALLSAFEEEPVAVETKPEPKPETKPPVESPSPAGKSSVLTSGIELPSILNQSSPEPAPNPVPMASQTVPEPTPKPVVIEEEPSPQTTEVRGACEECGQQYVVDMPIGVQQAQIACPKCGNMNIIRR
ncbi:MAG: hypothetical protein CMB50_02985, partial [Euryarchaeota archaeon]|nr:hypothetical protein [Euryarchaeota archaeon]